MDGNSESAHPTDNNPPRAGSFRELWQVALPLILSSGSISLLYVVDRAFLTWHSTEALAASLPAALVHWTVVSIAIGTLMYVNTFVSQYDGAGQHDRVVTSLWQGMWLAIPCGVGFLLVAPLARPIFALIGHDSAIQDLEADYFAILSAGSFVLLTTTVLSCFYSGRGQTLTVMYVNLAMVSLNIILDYVLIFGIGPIPDMGIRGAAIATVVSNTFAGLLYAGLMLGPSVRREYAFWRDRSFDRELTGRLLRYGLPTGLQYLADIGAFTLFIIMLGTLGTEALAATNMAFNLNTMAFFPMMGLGTAVMTLTGRRIGEGQPQLAVRTTWLAFACSGSYMLVFAALFLLIPETLLSIYSIGAAAERFAAISDQTIKLLRFVAVFSFFDGMAIVFGSAVRGAGDTRFSLLFTLAAGWLLMVLPTAVAYIGFGGNLMVSWIACTTYIVVMGIGFLIRFQQGHWKSMTVIESFSEESTDSVSSTSQSKPKEHRQHVEGTDAGHNRPDASSDSCPLSEADRV